ncbi:MAG: aminotransferase class V-fold PLP-dependent enzyme [Planctomycetota bacterium]
MKRPRIYLDHAATRFPKPEVVLRAMHDYSLDREAAAGRGAYRSAQDASARVTALRQELAHWIGASEHEISLHAGGTEALNAAIFGLLSDGDHVVTTAAEHNSVLRPLQHLVDRGTIEWTIAAVNEAGQVNAEDVLAAVRPNTRLVTCVHAANVNGAVQPIETIGTGLRRLDPKPLLLCDAAQTFGYLPLDVNETAIDLLAAPGHKGGMGPLGTGLLYARESIHEHLQPTVFGGTGTSSESLQMPNDYPDSFEAGNRNVPALVGWLEGLEARRGDEDAAKILQSTAGRLRELAEFMYSELTSIESIRVLGTPTNLVLPVASFSVLGMSAAEVAMILDAEFGIEVRSGLHCAALVHRPIGSPEAGTVRVSGGETTSRAEIAELVAALRQIAE